MIQINKISPYNLQNTLSIFKCSIKIPQLIKENSSIKIPQFLSVQILNSKYMHERESWVWTEQIHVDHNNASGGLKPQVIMDLLKI
jgi:hypothetical protein